MAHDQGSRFVDEALSVDAIQKNERVLAEMRQAVLAGDRARCDRAASRKSPRDDSASLDHAICRSLPEISRVKSRLDDARSRA